MEETVEIQSDISYFPIVEDRLFCFCDKCNLGDSYSLVSVATFQAVKNAIVHGNKNDLNRIVKVVFGTYRRGVYVEVCDEGVGFDTGAVEGELKMGGAVGSGLYFMHSLADSVKFEDCGSKVRMEFAIGGINPTRALSRISILNSHFSQVRIGSCA